MGMVGGRGSVPSISPIWAKMKGQKGPLERQGVSKHFLASRLAHFWAIPEGGLATRVPTWSRLTFGVGCVILWLVLGAWGFASRWAQRPLALSSPCTQHTMC